MKSKGVFRSNAKQIFCMACKVTTKTRTDTNSSHTTSHIKLKCFNLSEKFE